MEENAILDPNQGVFRKGHSTINIIPSLTNDIFKGVNDGELTTSCFINMAKAFDTVNHSILRKKLYKMRIKGKNLNWVKNYLNQRKQCTNANGMTSSFLNISLGVPQGSILFFIVYMNDVKSSLYFCKHLLYADQ